jgi:hypothetical protein
MEMRELVEGGRYERIVLVTHRGFLGFLVLGGRFGNLGELSFPCVFASFVGEVGLMRLEMREYRFPQAEEMRRLRGGVHVDSGLEMDYGYVQKLCLSVEVVCVRPEPI